MNSACEPSPPPALLLERRGRKNQRPPRPSINPSLNAVISILPLTQKCAHHPADVRCRRVILGPAILDAAWQTPGQGHRGGGGQMVGRISRLSAFFQEVDYGLGVGVPEDGELSSAETVCEA